jgi:hypothetical protein
MNKYSVFLANMYDSGLLLADCGMMFAEREREREMSRRM